MSVVSDCSLSLMTVARVEDPGRPAMEVGLDVAARDVKDAGKAPPDTEARQSDGRCVDQALARRPLLRVLLFRVVALLSDEPLADVESSAPFSDEPELAVSPPDRAEGISPEAPGTSRPILRMSRAARSLASTA